MPEYKNVRRRRITNLLAAIGLGFPRTARFEGAPGAGAGAAGGGTATADGDDAGAGGDGAAAGAGDDDAAGTAGAGGAAPDEAKAKLDAVTKESIQRREKIRKLETELVTLKGRMPDAADLEAFKTWRAEKEKLEEDKKKAEGRFEELIHQTRTKHAAEIAALRTESETNRERWTSERINNALATEIPKHTNVAIEDVVALLKPSVSIDPESGEFVIRGPGGVHPLNEKGHEMALGEWVQKEIERRPHFKPAQQTGGSGSAPSQRGRTGSKLFTEDEISKMSHEEFKKNEEAIYQQMKG